MNPEDLLTDALRDRTEHTDYPSTPLATVAARAGAIRARRRRTTVLAAAAAVALVAVPSALWLGRSPGTSPQPATTLSSGPTTQPTAHTSPFDLGSLPKGAKPGIDYLVGDTYVTMNGDRITDPVFRNATAATPVRGGILVSVPPAPGMFAQDGIGSTDLVSDGRHQYLGCGSDRFAMSTDGVESAYWLADSCPFGSGDGGALYSGVNNTMGESGPGHVATPAGSVYEPIGIVQQGTVVNVTHGRSVHAEIVGSGSGSTIAALSYAGGSDENNDVVSGVLAEGSTGAVVDAATGAVKWRAPWILGQFSNDGKYVLGYQPGDGIGTDSYAILDATTGNKVVELPHLGMAVSLHSLTWDFDDTVLAVASTDQDEAIVRFDQQGNLTRATPTRPVGDTYAYRLATRP
ncbi:MAG: hypothetical protein WB797_07155 [Nocardioides sp.]